MYTENCYKYLPFFVIMVAALLTWLVEVGGMYGPLAALTVLTAELVSTGGCMLLVGTLIAGWCWRDGDDLPAAASTSFFTGGEDPDETLQL